MSVDRMDYTVPKCFDCGVEFSPDDAEAHVGDTYAFCSEPCLSAFKAGLGF